MDYTVSREQYGLLENTLNLGASCLIKSGLSVGKLEAPSILNAAQRTTGLHDWGPDDFIERLERLTTFAQAAPITSLARIFARQTFIKAVTNRLKMFEHLRNHPEIRQIEIKKPIFIVGFPRTGTTLLQNLLTLESGRRSLKFWELTAPTPVHDDPDIDRSKRRQTADRLLRLAYLISPEMADIHEIGTDNAEECWPLFANTFAVMNYDLSSGFRSYGDWLLERDMTGPYREFRLQLQLLAAQQETENFVLKCPEHLWFLDSLLKVFPDACIVWTHRDPVASIASYCSLVSLNRRTFYGNYDPHALGAHISDRFLTGIKRAMTVCEKVGQDRFFHVNFDTLVADPTSTVQQICTRFDYAYGSDLAKAIDEWQQNGRRDKRGRHKYSAERYGLDVSSIHQRYADYIETFQIAVKTPNR